jgi:hypothetical protein
MAALFLLSLFNSVYKIIIHPGPISPVKLSDVIVKYVFSPASLGSLILSLCILLSSVNIFAQSHIMNEVITVPPFPVDPSPRRVLVLSTVDLEERGYRSSKEELFAELIDSVKVEISHLLKDHDQIPCEVLFGSTLVDSAGATVFAQMKQYEASHAIVISFYNVHFLQTEVQVTEDKNGKDKEAYYDIESIVRYQLYNDQVMAMEMPMTTSRYHSHRSVISGLLAAGPNVVKNRDDALSISRENAMKYLMQFFPLTLQRTRKLFDKKELSKVKAAYCEKGF